MTRARRAASLAAGLLLLALPAAVCLARFEVTTSIAHFLPAGTDERLGHVSHAVADSVLTRTVVLSIGADGPERAVRAAADVAAALARSPRVAWVRGAVDEDFRLAVHDVYFPHRLALLSDAPEAELPARLADDGLRAATRDLRRRLALPSGAAVRPLAPADPLLAFPAFLERMRLAETGDLELREGQLVTADGRRGVVFLGSQPSAFDTGGQRALQADIAAAVAAAERRLGAPLDLAQSGAGRFAIAAERSIRADITRISAVSSVAIVLLFGVLFRSWRALLLVALPLAAGIAGATATVLVVHGAIHGLTLAFGSTLIGVAIDYAVHLQCHHALAPAAGGPAATLRRIRGALVVGAATTVVGLAGLAVTRLPGIREIALFACSGVAFALAATALLLPPLLGASRRAPALERLGRALGRALDAMARRRRALALLPLGALALSLAALPAVSWRDDVRAFQALDPDVLAEDERVRAQISRVDASRLVVALGDDDEAALCANDRVFAALEAARSAREVESFSSAHPLLSSAELQRRNRATVDADPTLPARLRAALEAEGFRPDAFAPFFDHLAAPPPPALTYRDLAASPLADLARPFRADVGTQTAYFTFVRGVRDAPALARRLAAVPGALYFDQHEFLGDAWRHGRTRTVQLALVGFLAVILAVLLRYRRPGLALAAVAPALLAASSTLALLTLAGVEATILHVVGLLLVLSMGVDYGVFMVESRADPRELEATAAAVVVACLSTVLAFGLLALSANPALCALGLTTGLGVLLSLVLAPTALVLLARDRR